MRKTTPIKRRIEVSLAAAISLGAGFTAFVQPGEARNLLNSIEVRDMIQAPLLSEYGLQDKRIDFTRQRSSAFEADREAVRPSASQFAAEFADASFSVGAPAAFSTLDSQSVTVASLPSGGRVSVAVFDAFDPTAARIAFDESYVQAGGRLLAAPRERPQGLALRYERSFDSPGGFEGLDIGVAPRAGVSIATAGAAAEFGGTVRLGQYLDGPDEQPRWWVFAGADRQALLFDPGAGFNMLEAFTLEPYAVVGDAQAGLAARLGPADISLAYVRRETVFSLPTESWEQSEDFVAFTFSMRR